MDAALHLCKYLCLTGLCCASFMSSAHQWNLPETRLPLGEVAVSENLQTQVALQEDVTFTDNSTCCAACTFFCYRLTNNSVLVDLNYASLYLALKMT